jgi:hypothetical protein
MTGGSSHRRAVTKAAKERLVQQVATTVLSQLGGDITSPTAEGDTRSLQRRLFEWIEHPFVTLACGTICGIAGTLFYAPILAVCGACVLLGFHRANVVSGKRMVIQILVYCLLAITTVGSLYGLRNLIQNKLQENNTSISEIVATKLLNVLTPYLRSRPATETAHPTTSKPSKTFRDLALKPMDLKIIGCGKTLNPDSVARSEPNDNPQRCRFDVYDNRTAPSLSKGSLFQLETMGESSINFTTSPVSKLVPTFRYGERVMQLELDRSISAETEPFVIWVEDLPPRHQRYEIKLKIFLNDGRTLGTWAIDMIPFHEGG